jgi:ribosomal protein L37E
MSTNPNPAMARLRAAQGKIITCTRCGSHHFHEVQTSRYLSGGYGTVAIQPDPEAQTFPLLVCICGMPQLPVSQPGRKAGGVYEAANAELRKSVTDCQTYLNSQDPKALGDYLLQVAAAKGVEGAVETLKEKVKGLEDAVTAPAPKKKDADAASSPK